MLYAVAPRELMPWPCRVLECFAWVVVLDPTTGQSGKARAASFSLPKSISDLVLSGVELGDADDQV
jgi:inosine/xanthosine triphosphatase